MRNYDAYREVVSSWLAHPRPTLLLIYEALKALKALVVISKAHPQRSPGQGLTGLQEVTEMQID